MKYARDGQDFDINANQVIGDVQYPAGWFHSAEHRAAMNVLEVIEAKPEYDPLTHSCIRTGGELYNGQWRYTWTVTALGTTLKAVNLAAALKQILTLLDKDTDDLIYSVIGHKATEYERAEREAQAYVDAEYVGDVPVTVAAHVAALECTPAEAAALILSTAESWRSAQATLRSHRLLRKAQARAATTTAELTVIKAAWQSFIAELRAQLGV